MTKQFKTDVIVKDVPNTKGQNKYIYLKNVPVYFAKVFETQYKHKSQTEKEYTFIAFVDTDTREKMELPLDEGGVAINKELREVGKGRNKFKKIKYPLSKQLKEGEKTHYDEMEGLHGMQLTLDEFSKIGRKNVLKVVDSEGNDWPKDKLLGNGTVVHVKLWSYVNQDEQLVVYPNLIVVVDHVPFESSGQGGVIEDDVLGISIDMSGDFEDSVREEAFDEEPDFVDDFELY